jgi:glyoxylase-like metal-dependent hydrolase (beta-lactamase superfamily II)
MYMKLTALTVGSIGTNCYIVYDETSKAAVVIDPGDEAALVEARIKALGLRVLAILLTHGHFDHVLGLEMTAQAWKIDAWMHPDDKMILDSSIDWCAQLGLTLCRFSGTMHDLADGETLRFGHTELKVLATPGHTPGGVCFLNETDKIMFTGDTLFAGSIGRTDHVGGDYDQLIHSIETQLLPLDGEIKILPGHGPNSSIGYERATNPFLQGL